VDYKRLYKIDQFDAFFVTRAKEGMNFRRVYSHAKDIKNGVLVDQSIMFNNYQSAKDYPKQIRRIKFKDNESGKTFIFLTNNFTMKATDIALLYKYRWGVELFLNG